MGALAIFAGVVTAGAGHKGAGEQLDIDRSMVELSYRDNLEKIRRRGFTQEKTKGRAKAFSENAGVLHSGGSTAQGYLDTLSNEFRAELNWMKDYAKAAKSLGLEKAGVDYDANRMAALQAGMNTGASVYGMGS